MEKRDASFETKNVALHLVGKHFRNNPLKLAPVHEILKVKITVEILVPFTVKQS